MKKLSIPKPDVREKTLEHGISFPFDEELIMPILGSGTKKLPIELMASKIMEILDSSDEDKLVEKTSFLYYVDSDGNIQQLQQIYTTTDRQVATLSEIPQALIDATVAIEDKRFYEHQGVDWITTVKACLNMFFGGA